MSRQVRAGPPPPPNADYGTMKEHPKRQSAGPGTKRNAVTEWAATAIRCGQHQHSASSADSQVALSEVNTRIICIFRKQQNAEQASKVVACRHDNFHHISQV